MAANGWTGTQGNGRAISGVDAAEGTGVQVFHAGTARDGEGRLIATGGRVLNVTALGGTVAEAKAKAYRAIDAIDWRPGFCRRAPVMTERAREGATRPGQGSENFVGRGLDAFRRLNPGPGRVGQASR